MRTDILDSRTKRISIAVAVLTGVILIGAAAYTFFGSSLSRPVNGLKIIGAARAYTHALQQSHAPVPQTVPLQTLVDKGLLQPADIGSFQGLDATLWLTAPSNGPAILMRARLPDGSDFVLLADGRALEVKR